MKTQHIALAVTIALLGAVYAFAQTGASVADRGFPGRYQLQSGSIVQDPDAVATPTIFRIDTLTGDVDYVVGMPGPKEMPLQVWSAVMDTEEYVNVRRVNQ